MFVYDHNTKYSIDIIVSTIGVKCFDFGNKAIS